MELSPLRETEQYPLAVSVLSKKYDIFDRDVLTDFCLLFDDIVVQNFEALVLFVGGVG